MSDCVSGGNGCFQQPTFNVPCVKNTLYNKHPGVEIQRQETTQDAFGGQVDTWTTVATVTGNLQPKGEEQHNPEERGPRSAIFYTQETFDIKYRDRLVFRGRTWIVTHVDKFDDNINFEDHHIEAHLETLEPSTDAGQN